MRVEDDRGNQPVLQHLQFEARLMAPLPCSLAAGGGFTAEPAQKILYEGEHGKIPCWLRAIMWLAIEPQGHSDRSAVFLET
jgi:hypothetical protein